MHTLKLSESNRAIITTTKIAAIVKVPHLILNLMILELPKKKVRFHFQTKIMKTKFWCTPKLKYSKSDHTEVSTEPVKIN